MEDSSTKGLSVIQFLSLMAQGDEFSSLNAIYFENPQNSDFFSWRNSFENVFLVDKESGIFSIKYQVSFFNHLRPKHNTSTMTLPL